MILPLQRQLDAGRVEQRELWQTPEGRLASLDDALYAGLLLEGGRAFVIELASRIVRRLEAEPLTRGAYNFLVLSPRKRSLRVVLIPRRAEALKLTRGSLGQQGLGAFNLGGIMVLARPDVCADLGTAFLSRGGAHDRGPGGRADLALEAPDSVGRPEHRRTLSVTQCDPERFLQPFDIVV